MSKRLVEVYIGWVGCTWSTETVRVPADVPEDRLESVARRIWLDSYHGTQEVVFVGLYFAHSADFPEED